MLVSAVVEASSEKTVLPFQCSFFISAWLVSLLNFSVTVSTFNSTFSKVKGGDSGAAGPVQWNRAV